MTAASCFLGTGAAYILTDAGTYSATGTILDICSKVECSDRLHLAIAASGEECIVRVEQGIYSPINAAFKLPEEAEDQADFLAKLPDAMRVYHGFMERSGYSGYFQYMVALWNKATNISGDMLNLSMFNRRNLLRLKVSGCGEYQSQDRALAFS